MTFTDDDDDSEIEYLITGSKNNQPKRPTAEKCLFCHKAVKKTSDNLINKNSNDTNEKYAVYLQ